MGSLGFWKGELASDFSQKPNFPRMIGEVKVIAKKTTDNRIALKMEFFFDIGLTLNLNLGNIKNQLYYAATTLNLAMEVNRYLPYKVSGMSV